MIDHDLILQPEVVVVEARPGEAVALQVIPPFAVVVLIPVLVHAHLVPDRVLKELTGIRNQEYYKNKILKSCAIRTTNMLEDWKDWRNGVFGIVSMVHTIFSVILI